MSQSSPARDAFASDPPPAPAPPGVPIKVSIEHLAARYGRVPVLRDVTLPIHEHRVTAIIGPSGCGKSTLLRCINRMHEVTEGASVEGKVLVDGVDVYAPRVDPPSLRRRIGMVFQRANPLPMMTVRDNVLAGLRLSGLRPRRPDDLVERMLRRVALWDELKDALDRPGTSLAGGQQQRLCIARCLALEPEVLLMDEPCANLDPVGTARIEELLNELRTRVTVVLVTHNMQQAARVADSTAFVDRGELVEHGPTDKLFTNPRNERTEAYLTGRFG